MSPASFEETRRYLDSLYTSSEEWRSFIDACKTKIPYWLKLDENCQVDTLDKDVQQILESNSGPTKIWTILSYEPSLLTTVIALLQKLYHIENDEDCKSLFHFYTAEASFLTLTKTAFPEKDIAAYFSDFILREYTPPFTEESFTKLIHWWEKNPDILSLYETAFGTDSINQIIKNIMHSTSPCPR